MDPNNASSANESNANGAAAKKKRFNPNRNFQRRNVVPTRRPVSVEIPRPTHSSGGDTDDSENLLNFDRSFNVPATEPSSIDIGGENGGYAGWKLYFPTQGT